MKTVLALSALFLTLALSAQTSDSVKIKASDPTQLYTFVEAYGGYNVTGSWEYGLGADIWEAGFRGNWAIKNVRIGVFLPTSYQDSYNYSWGLDDIAFDAGYQLHNNSGLYNSTLIIVGYSFGAEDNFFRMYDTDSRQTAQANRSCFNTFFINYVGAIKVSDKLAFYPGVEWFHRSYTKLSVGYVKDSTYLNSYIHTSGFKFSGTVSYDFNPKNFVQFYAGWSFENWNGANGQTSELDDYYSGISQKRLNMNIKYQHAFNAHAQGYVKLIYGNYSFDQPSEQWYWVEPNLVGLQLGFTYFLP